MKRLALILLLAFTCAVSAQTDQVKLREQIKSLKGQQRAAVDRIEKDLKGSKDYAATLWTDLEKAQTQVNQVGKERDGWRDYGNDQHDKFINAEKRVAEKQVTILKLYMALAGLGLVIGAYLFAKFYLRLPI